MLYKKLHGDETDFITDVADLLESDGIVVLTGTKTIVEHQYEKVIQNLDSDITQDIRIGYLNQNVDGDYFYYLYNHKKYTQNEINLFLYNKI